MKGVRKGRDTEGWERECEFMHMHLVLSFKKILIFVHNIGAGVIMW